MKSRRPEKTAISEDALAPEGRYSRRLYGFEKYYLTLVLLSAAAVMCGIAVAIFLNLLVGASTVLLAAFAYVYFVGDEARKQLGIRYANIGGHIVIKSLACVYGDCLAVPAKFIYADVRVLDDGALDTEKNQVLTRLYLPRTLRRIGKNILGDTPHPITVCFEGTREEWSAIDTQTDFCGCEILFECEQPCPQNPSAEAAGDSSEVDK